MTTAPNRLFIALALLAFLAAGCGGGDEDPAKRLGEEGGVRARFEVVAAEAPVMAELLLDRADSFGIDASIRASGARTVEVAVPGEPGRARKAIARLTRPGRLAFYDWERNVIGPRGRPEPADPTVTGGPAAGSDGDIPLYEAVVRAAKRPAIRDGDNSHRGWWYAVDHEQRSARGQFAERPEGSALRVRPGTVIVQAERRARESTEDRWYVLEDDVVLAGDHIADPEAGEDTTAGDEPNVRFDFTEDGAARWAALTREVARRGQRLQPPGTDSATAAHHFAVVLDDEIISVPYVDFGTNPDGVDASNGAQITGGFTKESAEELAALLRAEPLPAPLVPLGEEVVRGG